MFNAKRLTVFLAAIAGSLVLTASASAAQRVASDSGSGTACTAGAPCQLRNAVESAAAGDEVIVNSGSYSLSSRLELPPAADRLVVRGASGQARPRISSSADIALAVSATQRVQDLELEHTGSNVGLYLAGGTAERVYVHSTGDAACAPYGAGAPNGAVIRDSVCWNTRSGSGGWAISVTAGSTAPDSIAPRLRNVTAVTTSPSEPAVRAHAGNNVQISIDARNTVALAPGVDVAASANGVGGSNSSVTLRTSSFAHLSVSGGSSISSPSSNGNQAAEPVFAGLGTGDFRQAAASPTIDAGSVDDHVGTLDLDREARVQGAAVDIGADEIANEPVAPPPPPPGGEDAPPVADTDPPEVTIDRAPARRMTRRGAKFRFSSDEPGTTFECAIDGRPLRSCVPPTRYRRLRSGRHVFYVYGTDAAGNADSTPATYRWRITR